jgi:hypothetical protein
MVLSAKGVPYYNAMGLYRAGADQFPLELGKTA